MYLFRKLFNSTAGSSNQMVVSAKCSFILLMAACLDQYRQIALYAFISVGDSPLGLMDKASDF